MEPIDYEKLKLKSAVLMSAVNPDGVKLEELAASIVVEVEAKNKQLFDSSIGGEMSVTGKQIANNNRSIVQLAKLIVAHQLDTMKALDTIGPDKGTKGKPRI